MGATALAQSSKRPNILCISCENLGPQLGCYGDSHASTPAIDAFAAGAIRFERAYAVSGIGPVSRSSIQTAMFPSTIGTHTGGSAALPAFVKPFSEYLKAAGYFIAGTTAKTGWKNRPEGSPFFLWTRLDAVNPSRIRLRGDAYERTVRTLKPDQRKSPDQLPFPAQFEDTEESRRDWANYYEMIALLDRQFAARLKDLPSEEPTVIVFFSEYGFTLREGNSAAYESGTRVPMLIRLPAGEAKSDSQLTMLLDVGPTLLNVAGVEVPGHMQGRAVLGSRLSAPRRAVFATCDRPDNRYELVRSVRDSRYRYVRNFTRGTEELFDSNADAAEVKDILVANPAVAARLKDRWERWRDETHDLGLIPEAEVAVREALLRTRYAIGRQAGYDALARRLTEIAGTQDAAKIREALDDEDAAVKAWACGKESAPVIVLKKLLADASGAVRVAAALRLRKVDGADGAALRVLLRALRSTEEWVRVAAALALEELNGKDLTVLNALQAVAKADPNRVVAAVAARAVKGLT